MADCPHRRLDVHLNQAHFGDTNVKYFELTAKCEVCGVDMTFPGVPDVGQSPDKPMVNIDATEIRFPVDRKSVVSGKSVSVRVDRGGRRSLKNKQNQSSNT